VANLFSSPGTLAAAKRVLVTLLSMLQTRLEMAAVELGEEKSRLLSLIFTGLASFLFLSFGILVLSFLIVAFYWDTYRYTALAALAVVYAFIGGVLWLRLQHMIAHQPPAFSYTLAELGRDSDALARSAEADEIQSQTGNNSGGPNS